jgi:cytochrome P450
MIAAESIKGPRGEWFLGNNLQFGRDPLGFLERCSREFGDVVPMRIGTGVFYLLNGPADIEAVFTNSKRFAKANLIRNPLMRRISGNGIFLSEGEFWVRQRRLLQPAFHRDRIAAYAEIMTRYATDVCARWQTTSVVEIREEMMRLTLAIVCKAQFNTEIGDSRCSEIGDAMEVLTRHFAPSPNLLRVVAGLFLPVGRQRFEAAARQLDSVIYRLIGEHGSLKPDSGDLLSMLIRAQNEEGEGMTSSQLRDEVITLLLAGHETTALVLTWSCYLISQHREIETRICDELEAVLGGRMAGFEDSTRLQYLGKVVKEAMRLYPPVWLTAREMLDDNTLGNCTLEKGAQLFMSQWVVHRDSRFYPNPHEFNPQRWTEDFVQNLPKFAFFPFGGGPRVCIGQSFAMLEMILVLAAIFQKWSLRLCPGQEILPHPSLTLRPKGPVQMLVEKRAT